jgi:hypothetical protein
MTEDQVKEMYGTDINSYLKLQAEALRLNAEIIDLEDLAIEKALKIKNKVNNIIEAGATELKVTEGMVESYAESLKKLGNVNGEQAAKIAVSNIRLAKGISTLKETFEEYESSLDSFNPLEYAEAIGAIKKSFDTTFGSNVSTDFIKKNINEIRNMLNGSEEDFQKIKFSIFGDWVNQLSELNIDGIENLSSWWESFSTQIANAPLETDLIINSEGALDSLNEALRVGATTKEEIE